MPDYSKYLEHAPKYLSAAFIGVMAIGQATQTLSDVHNHVQRKEEEREQELAFRQKIKQEDKTREQRRKQYMAGLTGDPTVGLVQQLFNNNIGHYKF